jgi:hypothetical protein
MQIKQAVSHWQALPRGHWETSSSKCRQTLVPIPDHVIVTHRDTHTPPTSFPLSLITTFSTPNSFPNSASTTLSLPTLTRPNRSPPHIKTGFG